jgi:hypothetical protein
VLLQNPEVINEVPRDVVIGTWTYDTLADFHRHIAPFQSKGFSVLVTPGVLNSSNVLPNFRQSFLNIERFIRDGVAHNVMGGMLTVWDDGGSAFFSADWYGVALGADRMWNCDTLDRSFRERFDLALYGDPAHGLSRGIDSLMHVGDYAQTDGMSEKIIWSSMVPGANQELRLNAVDWDHVLEAARSADALLQSGKPVVASGDIETVRFDAALYQGVAHLCLGMRDAARLYRGAIKVQKTDPVTARRSIVEAWNIVADLKQEFANLKRWYGHLWLNENRLYSLDLVERNYDERIADLADVENRLRGAVGEMDKGQALPLPGDVRLDVVESTGRYFKDWLVTGPIAGNDVATDYLAPMGGEAAKAAPQVTQEFSYEGRKYRWSRLSARTASDVDFLSLHSDAGSATMYAFATVESPIAATVPALLGMGGAGRVILNGSIVFERSKGDGLVVDGDTVHLPLAKGTNQLMLKICRTPGSSWAFSLQLPQCDVRNRKNRYKIAATPTH